MGICINVVLSKHCICIVLACRGSDAIRRSSYSPIKSFSKSKDTRASAAAYVIMDSLRCLSQLLIWQLFGKFRRKTVAVKFRNPRLVNFG